jgi:hypothetical protein
MIRSLRPFDKLRAGSSGFARALHPNEERPLVGDPRLRQSGSRFFTPASRLTGDPDSRRFLETRG